MAVRAAQRRQQSNSFAPSDRLLQTRLPVPPVPPDRVDRPRLHARIEQGLQRKLLLVTAPAGSGKTTLLSAWRATDAGQAWPLAWVSLTADDAHPPRFWSYVELAASTRSCPALARRRWPCCGRREQAPPERVLTELINRLSALPDDIVVVLDDYHLITNPAVHEGVAFLIEHMPPQMHVVIAAQADPPLPLARLRAHGALAELHAADLRFTAEEVADFLTRTMGLPLAPDDVALLEAETEGWIAGLQLVALALQGLPPGSDVPAAFRGGHRFIVDYLAAEVLARQPREVQDFLLDTAILIGSTAALRRGHGRRQRPGDAGSARAGQPVPGAA